MSEGLIIVDDVHPGLAIDAEERVQSGAALLRARSKAGPLFGLTQRDIDGAARRLVEGWALTPGQRFSKRLLDIVLTTPGIVAMLPFVPAIALAIKLESPGPVFYRQRRVGRGGREFGMLKFRTMRLDVYSGEDMPPFERKPDPRVSRFGRFLRRYSLDELPQLWNVLVGDMSLVGPRPPLVSEQYDRLPLLPGISGLWAMSPTGYISSWEEMEATEEEYARTWSLGLDLRIMGRLIAVMAGADPTGGSNSSASR